MEIVVGHFGYLAYASTSEISLGFPLELVGFARKLYSRTRHRESRQQDTPDHQARREDKQHKSFVSSTDMNDDPSPQMNFIEGDGQQHEQSLLPSLSEIATFTMNGDPELDNFDLFIDIP